MTAIQINTIQYKKLNYERFIQSGLRLGQQAGFFVHIGSFLNKLCKFNVLSSTKMLLNEYMTFYRSNINSVAFSFNENTALYCNF